MALNLITEFTDFKLMDIIIEGEGSEKRYKIKGPFLQSEIKNLNGRIYPKSLIKREIQVYNDERIAKKRSVGELDHPTSPSINMDRISHLIESLQMVGNDGIGVARLLDTPCGRIAQTLVKEGVVYGVSTRGVGSLKENQTVNDDFKLIAVDIVMDPSAPEAFVNGILENKEFIIKGDMIIECAVNMLQRQVNKKYTVDDSELLLSYLCEFINDITYP